MSAPFFQRRRRAAAAALPALTLSNAAVDESAAPGTVVGTLAAPGPGWRFFLADGSDGRFQIAGDRLLVGTSPLSRSALAFPTVLVAATDGTRSTATLFTLTVRRALAALPLASGAKVMGFGHSMIDRAGWGIVVDGPPQRVSSLSQSNARGVLPWVRLLDDRFNLDAFEDLADPYPAVSGWGIGGAFQGISGDHLVAANGLPGTLARTPYVASMRPAIVYLHIGENDINSSVASAAELIDRLDRQLALLRDEGIRVVIQTLCHRGTGSGGGLWPDGDPRHDWIADANSWIRAQAGREGVRVCDTTALGFNRPSFNPDLFAADQIHVAPEGARAIADVLLPILRDMVAAGAAPSRDAAAGNLWPAPTLAGTSGAKAGAPVPTGLVAAGHTVQLVTGTSLIACSKEVDGNGFEKQVVTITPANDGSASRVHTLRVRANAAALLSALGVAPGDWLEGFVYAELSAWDGWLGLVWQIESQNTGGTYLQSVLAGLVNGDAATKRLFKAGNAGFAGWLKMCAFRVPDGADRLALNTRPIELTWDKTAAGTGTVKLSRPILRKAGNPKAAWNL